MPYESERNDGVRDSGESEPDNDNDLELLEVDKFRDPDETMSIGLRSCQESVTDIPTAIAVPRPPPKCRVSARFPM